MADLPTIVRAPQAGGPPERIVVLIHGLGAEGRDLIDLAPMLAPALPHAMFAAPDAPFPYDMGPFGRQWFSVRSRAPSDMAVGIAKSSEILSRFLQQLMERNGLPASALALLGFSQGAMMALHVGLRLRPSLAAIVGFSGRLMEAPGLPDDHAGAPPVLLVHGSADDVVPASGMAVAKAALRARGVFVECCLRPGLGHAIDPEGLSLAAKFLAKAFDDQPAG